MCLRDECVNEGLGFGLEKNEWLNLVYELMFQMFRLLI